MFLKNRENECHTAWIQMRCRVTRCLIELHGVSSVSKLFAYGFSVGIGGLRVNSFSSESYKIKRAQAKDRRLFYAA